MRCLINIIIILIFFIIQVCSTPHNFSLHKRLTHSQSNFSKACEEALLSYYECSADIVDFNLVALDIVCFYFKTEKCQNFIKNGINTIPECKNEDNDLIEWSNIFLKINYFTNNFYCAKLENTNRYCPIIEWICEGSEVDGNKTYENSHYTVAFKDTCQSRVCYDAIINYNKELKQYRKEMNKYNTFFVDPSIMKRNVYPNNNTYYRISPEELFKEAVISLPKECNDTTTRKNNDDLNTKAINLNDNNTLTNHAHSIYHNLTYIFITILLSVLFEQ